MNFDSINFNHLEQTLLKNDLWYWTNQSRYLKGEPWDFGPRTYLKELYRDRARDKIVVKGRQVEMSEYSVNVALHFATTNPNTTTLYTFPSSDLCATFGNKRIKEAIQQSPKLEGQLIDDGNALTKMFKNRSYLYLRTSYGGGDKARSIDADMLICDEYQDFDMRSTSDVPARDVLMSNLDHSSFKNTFTFGTPKLRDAHFEHLWMSSSMKQWNVVCDECKLHQQLSLSNVINWDRAYERDVFDIVYYGCVKCKTELDRYSGYWKSTSREGTNFELSGYHISQLMVPWKTAGDILRAHGTKHIKGKSTRAFQNEVLGNFYSGSDQPFNEAVLELCYDTTLSLEDACYEPTYLGVDWGDTSTVAIIKYDVESDYVTLVNAFKFNDPDIMVHAQKIAELAQRYQVSNMVMDFGYGKAPNTDLIRRYPQRAWACIYSHSKEATLFKWDAKKAQVAVDREATINLLVDRFEKGHNVSGGITIPRTEEARAILAPFLQEMKNIVAVQKHNRTIYERIGSGDHFAHAMNYAVIAAKRAETKTKYPRTIQTVRAPMGGARTRGGIYVPGRRGTPRMPGR